MNVLKAVEAFRREEPFGGFCETLAALEQNSADAVGAVSALHAAREVAKTVKAADFTDQGLTGPTLGAAIEAAQVRRIAALLEQTMRGT